MRVESLHLHGKYLIAICTHSNLLSLFACHFLMEFVSCSVSGKSRQLMVRVYDAVKGTAIANTGFESLPAASGSPGLQRVGKAVLDGDKIYVPIYVDSAGSWVVSETLTLPSRQSRDVFILELDCSSTEGKVTLRSDWSQPKLESSTPIMMSLAMSMDKNLLAIAAMNSGDGVTVAAGHVSQQPKTGPQIVPHLLVAMMFSPH